MIGTVPPPVPFISSLLRSPLVAALYHQPRYWDSQYSDYSGKMDSGLDTAAYYAARPRLDLPIRVLAARANSSCAELDLSGEEVCSPPHSASCGMGFQFPLFWSHFAPPLLTNSSALSKRRRVLSRGGYNMKRPLSQPSVASPFVVRGLIATMPSFGRNHNTLRTWFGSGSRPILMCNGGSRRKISPFLTLDEVLLNISLFAAEKVDKEVTSSCNSWQTLNLELS